MIKLIILVLATITATTGVIVSFPPYDMLLCFSSGSVMGWTGMSIYLKLQR